MRMETSWRNVIPKPEFLSKIMFWMRTNNDEGRWYGHSNHAGGLIGPFFAASILFGYVDFYDLNVWKSLIPLSAFFCP